MTKLNDQIQEIQQSLTENALNERAFVAALSDALSQVDQHLVSEVRRLRDEHTARRGVILNELQSLSNSLCLFPSQPAPVTAIDHRTEAPPLPRNGSAQHAPGDWRKATSAIEDDLESTWRSPGANH